MTAFARTLRSISSAALALAILRLGTGPSAALTPGYRPVSADDLIRSPDRYLNRRIGLDAAFCHASRPGYVCVAVNAPLEIRVRQLPDGAAKRSIDRDCAGLDAIEHTPLPECRFAVVFIPTASASQPGEYIRNNKVVRGRITVLEAYGLALSKADR